MLEPTKLKQILEEFAQHVIDGAKRNLKTKGKNTSNKLTESLDYNIKVSKNSIQLDILGEDYLSFIDKGVSGIKKKYNTPFSYKSKGGLKGMPPPSAFDKWNIKKGRADRDEKGRFLTRKQLNFKTAVGVFYYGIEPSKFFTTPFENAFKSLPDEIIEAYGLDVDSFMELTLKNNLDAV
jgi:hypothetical protein